MPNDPLTPTDWLILTLSLAAAAGMCVISHLFAARLTPPRRRDDDD